MAQTFHKFKAQTLDQAYRAMREQLGGEAIVVRTANVQDGGLFGLLGQKMVEVTASVSDMSPAPLRRPSSVEKKYLASGAQESRADAVGSDERVSDTVAYFQKLVSEAQNRMGTAPRHPSGGGAARSVAPEALAEGSAARALVEGDVAGAPILPFRQPEARPKEDDAGLRKDVQEMREMLQVLFAEMPGVDLPAEFAPHYRALVERGVTRKQTADLLMKAAQGGEGPPAREGRVLVERLKMEVRKGIRVTGGIGLTAGQCRVVALVGATGVGKTTNLAKLAASFAVNQRAKVGLVTADTYRVAATEQLRVYADIIDLDIRVVNDAREMAAAVRVLRGHDLVLIDTAGGSPYNDQHTEELTGLLRSAVPDEVMLLLGAGTPLEDLRSAVTRFSCFKPTSLFFTKLDETRRYGPLFSLAAETGLPLSYFSVGQNVPDDLTLAHAGMVADLIVEGGDRRGRSS